MCRSMADIQSTAAEIRRGKRKKEEGKKLQGKNIMAPLLHKAAITKHAVAGGIHESSSPRVVQSASWHIRQLSSNQSDDRRARNVSVLRRPPSFLDPRASSTQFVNPRCSFVGRTKRLLLVVVRPVLSPVAERSRVCLCYRHSLSE